MLQPFSDMLTAKCQSSSSSLTLKRVPLPTSGILIVCDTSTSRPHPFVPAGFFHTVFGSLHSLSHPGIRATQCLITVRYVWPSISSDIRRWARACIDCQQSKVQHHTITPLSTFATTDVRLDMIHIDIVVHLSVSKGHQICVSPHLY